MVVKSCEFVPHHRRSGVSVARPRRARRCNCLYRLAARTKERKSRVRTMYSLRQEARAVRRVKARLSGAHNILRIAFLVLEKSVDGFGARKEVCERASPCVRPRDQFVKPLRDQCDGCQVRRREVCKRVCQDLYSPR